MASKILLCTISLVLLFSSSFGQTTVEQAAVGGGCSTTVVKGLSEQLIDEMQCLVPNVMKSIQGQSKISLGSAAFPWLQTPAANALIDALRTTSSTISINSGLRTLPQQYLLFRWRNLGLCGITAAAAPGMSNHNGGLAIDINSYSSWINTLKAKNWIWYGSGDVVHFDFKGSGTQDIRSLSVKAFQRLWNRNNPNDRIAEDGVYGSNTEARLKRAPAGGFPNGASCPTTTPSGPTTCTLSSGVKGVCISTSECTGTSTAGLCPGPTNIQCCTNSQTSATSCKIASGATGTCIDTAQCGSGMTSVAGYCPGPNNIQCCVASTSSGQYSSMTINAAGIALIKSFEGFYPNFYIDPVGIRTIGYGHACHVFDCNNLQAKNSAGTYRRVTAPLTEVEATDLLRGDLDKGGYEQCVRTRVTRSGLTQNQFSALVSFVFNVGCGGFSGSTLLTRVNANAGMTSIREAFLMWNKGGGKVLPGLTRRRNAEADLYGGITTLPPPGTNEGGDCWFQSQKGVCLDISRCTGQRVTGLCPGGSNIQCCLGNKCTVNTANDGVCRLTSSCSGTRTSGRCYGAADIQCCTNSKRNEEEERLVVCPNGATWDKDLHYCVSSEYAFGPFPIAMEEECVNLGGGPDCINKIPIQVGNNVVNILRWSRDIALAARGNGRCPRGTRLDQNALGECVEFEGDAETGYTRMAVYAGYDEETTQICNDQAGGSACLTSRWSMPYYVSIMKPGGNQVVTDNETAVSSDEAVESGYFYINDQYTYSELVSTPGCERFCDAIEVLTGISVAVLIVIIAGAVIFIALSAVAGKKGYDACARHRKDMSNAQDNELYSDSGRSGANPFYNK